MRSVPTQSIQRSVTVPSASPCTVRLFSGPSSSTNPTCVSCVVSKISISTTPKPEHRFTRSRVNSVAGDAGRPSPTKAGACSWLLGRFSILDSHRASRRLFPLPVTSSTVPGSSISTTASRSSSDKREARPSGRNERSAGGQTRPRPATMAASGPFPGGRRPGAGSKSESRYTRAHLVNPDRARGLSSARDQGAKSQP